MHVNAGLNIGHAYTSLGFSFLRQCECQPFVFSKRLLIFSELIPSSLVFMFTSLQRTLSSLLHFSYVNNGAGIYGEKRAKTKDAYSLRLISRRQMKSLAFSEISLKGSSSKSYSPLVTLARVSASLSPRNGDRPDNLSKTSQQ